jgi:hypothetical protein
MSKLKNSLAHMRNAKVCVNGIEYFICDGEIDIDDEVAISYLLQNNVWRKVINRAPVCVNTPSINSPIDYSKMHKDEIVALLTYNKIQFDPKSKKTELVELAQQLQLGE